MTWQQQNFSRSEMSSMVNDAKKQAIDMNSRSKFKAAAEKQIPKQQFSLEGIENSVTSLLNSLLRQFNLDEDKALILVLIFVLYLQKADKSLLFALFYILL